MQFNIGNRLINKGEPPFIIAEMSGNHNKSLLRALEIVGLLQMQALTQLNYRLTQQAR